MSHCIKLFTGVQNDKIKVWHPNWIKQQIQQAPFSKEQQLLSLLYPPLLWDFCRSPYVLCIIYLNESQNALGWKDHNDHIIPNPFQRECQLPTRPFQDSPFLSAPCSVWSVWENSTFGWRAMLDSPVEKERRSAAHPMPQPAHGAATPPDLAHSEMGNAMLGSHNYKMNIVCVKGSFIDV